MQKNATLTLYSGAPDREDHTLTPLTSESSSTQSFQEFGDFLLPLNTAAAASNASRLLASRHDLLKRFRDQESMFGISGTGNVGILDPESSGSQLALLSSMSEEVEQSNSEFGDSFMNNWSQFTSQTTLASYHTHYSMSSIYQLSRESQLELNRDVPLGQGNFGVVYKGVLTRSNGAWDSVAVKTVRQHCSNHTFEALQVIPDLLSFGLFGHYFKFHRAGRSFANCYFETIDAIAFKLKKITFSSQRLFLA